MSTSVWRAFFHAGSRNGGDAVGDRLDAGDGRAAGGERLGSTTKSAGAQ